MLQVVLLDVKDLMHKFLSGNIVAENVISGSVKIDSVAFDSTTKVVI